MEACLMQRRDKSRRSSLGARVTGNEAQTLSKLIKISNTVGKDSSLVQGGGGNTSVKAGDGKYMYIKASGTPLKDMNRRAGWRKLQLEAVLSIIRDKSVSQLDIPAREAEVVNRLLLACRDKTTGNSRPSVEAHLHAFLGKCVIHLHPSAVIAYLNAKNGKAKLFKLFKDQKPPALWVPYAAPGFSLARKISKLIGDYQKRYNQKPSILLLEKHGLIVSANSPDSALRLVRMIIARCKSKLKQPKITKLKSIDRKIINETKSIIRKAFYESTGRHIAISYFYNNLIANFMNEKNAPQMLRPSALTPDELLYANGPAMWLEKPGREKIARKLTGQLRRNVRPTVAFLVKDIGLFIASKPKTVCIVRDIVLSSLITRANAFRMGGITSLTKSQRDFINHWEADAFRLEVAQGG
jgi:rhamnose utilization protein RhaD (predicted bifunctional aldolase and dehydrogenase)